MKRVLGKAVDAAVIVAAYGVVVGLMVEFMAGVAAAKLQDRLR